MIDIEVTANMKADRAEFSEDINNLPRYSVEYYRPFVLRTAESKDKCDTMDKCHSEAHIGEIVFRVVCVAATGQLVLHVGSGSVAVAM